jgi:hypothetical protein
MGTSQIRGLSWKLLLYYIALSGLVFLFQNCTRVGFTSVQQPTDPIQVNSSLGGEVYDGKLTFLEVEPGFNCESLVAPKSVLRRDKFGIWTLTVNEKQKCSTIESQVVTDVTFEKNVSSTFLKYKNINYTLDQGAPDTPVNLAGYLRVFQVDPNTNPNTADSLVGDGLCADSSGKCSLKAAIDEANSSVSIGSIIRVPAGVYKTTLNLSVGSTSFIGIYGEDPVTTIIQDGGTNGLITTSSIFASFKSPVHIENLSLNNGTSNVAFTASGVMAYSSVHIKNCRFENHRRGNTPVIYGGPGSGHILIENTRLINNDTTAIGLFGARGLTVTKSEIINNTGLGIDVNNGSWNVNILDTTIANNGAIGVNLRKCYSNCLIENSTISGNSSYGLVVTTPANNTLDDLIIKNTTITNNALTTGTNIKLDCEVVNPQHINFINSVVSKGISLNPNCEFTARNNAVMTATNSISDDNSCGGTGLLVTDPQLLPLANNGGFSLTHSFLATSPLLDAGDNSQCLSQDQRGFTRPIDKLGNGPVCDIGALEQQ